VNRAERRQAAKDFKSFARSEGVPGYANKESIEHMLAYQEQTIDQYSALLEQHVEEATSYPPAPLVRPTSPSERHSQ
jgi:hypothetical protein